MAVSKKGGLLHLAEMDSRQILDKLAARHSMDVFVPECKNGETWGAKQLLKLDAWAMKRSYSHFSTIGYEIKVSRADFEQDQKWTGYLGLCHEFFFCCPAGLIRATDLPEWVGLIWATENKLHIKRKAQRSQPDTERLNALLTYVVMSRCKVVANMYGINKQEPEDPLLIKRRHTERAMERKELADFVSRHVREVYDTCRAREGTFASRENYIKNFADRLSKLGIVWNPESNSWDQQYKVQNEIDMLANQIDHRTLSNMTQISKLLTELVAAVEHGRDTVQKRPQEVMGLGL